MQPEDGPKPVKMQTEEKRQEGALMKHTKRITSHESQFGNRIRCGLIRSSCTLCREKNHIL